MFDVTALGEILIDFTPCGDFEGVPVFAQNPGGAPLNVLAQNAILGGKTAFFRRGADCGQVPGFTVDTVDTNGAGDSFFGAIHYQLCNNNLEDLKNISVDRLTEIIRFVNAAGALTTIKKGAIPAMADIKTILKFFNEKS